jgi:hypothetical protein
VQGPLALQPADRRPAWRGRRPGGGWIDAHERHRVDAGQQRRGPGQTGEELVVDGVESPHVPVGERAQERAGVEGARTWPNSRCTAASRSRSVPSTESAPAHCGMRARPPGCRRWRGAPTAGTTCRPSWTVRSPSDDRAAGRSDQPVEQDDRPATHLIRRAPHHREGVLQPRPRCRPRHRLADPTLVVTARVCDRGGSSVPGLNASAVTVSSGVRIAAPAVMVLAMPQIELGTHSRVSGVRGCSRCGIRISSTGWPPCRSRRLT